jgi:hypothetical protein
MAKFDLSKEQYLCQDLRRGAPDHTYENDELIVLSWKSILDLNMGISSIDTDHMVEMIHRAHGGQMQGQKALFKLLLDAMGSRTCEACEGDGKSRGQFKSLSCDECHGAGIRLNNKPGA